MDATAGTRRAGVLLSMLSGDIIEVFSTGWYETIYLSNYLAYKQNLPLFRNGQSPQWI